MGLFGKKKVDEDKKAEVKKDADIKVEKKEVQKDKKPVKSTKKVSKKAVVAKKESRPGNAYRVLIRPIISEKATVGTSQNKYVFEIASDTNKVEVKKAVLEIYGVVPEAVNILNQRGKQVRFGRRFGSTKSIKKAVVTLKKGDSIKLYEGI